MPVEGSQAQQQGTQQYGLPQVNISSTSPATANLERIAHFTARLPESSINSFCGALAGVASGVVTCPLDVIKTKLQSQGGFKPRTSTTSPAKLHIYHGMFGTARVIWQQDGVRGMYRGLGPMLLGYFPVWAVYMGVYGTARDYYYTKIETKWLAHACASITAGACSTVVTNPIWVVKTRLQTQVSPTASKDSRTPWHYKNTADAFRKMYKAEGIRGFYSGLSPALLGLTHVAIQFPLYEYFKMKFTGMEMGSHSTQDSHWVEVAAATFLSKICASTATYPHEVLRTRLQTQQRRVSNELSGSFQAETSHRDATSGGNTYRPRYSGVIASAQTILKEEGWRAFYYGLGTNLIRAIPAAMTTMLTYESLKKSIQKMQEEALREPTGDASNQSNTP